MILYSTIGYFSPDQNYIMSMGRYTFLLLLCCLMGANSQFCSSLCDVSDTLHCLSTGYDVCNTNMCDTDFFNLGDCTTFFPNTALVLYQNLVNISSSWTISTVNTGITCNVTYRIPTGWFFSYPFYNKLVGGDYMYKNITVPVAHYQIKFKFSISYIGVWSSKDFIWLSTYDGLQTVNYNLTYQCIPGNTTDFICSLTLNASNHVDCIQPYEYYPLHNTSSMLFNFTYLTNEKDSTIKFWNVFDFLIIAVKCDISCATCYNSTPTACISCANGYYLTPNNTCTATCTSPLYILPAPQNPLTGQCVTACPQGYYLSGTTCLTCQAGCLACMSATLCTLYSPDDPNYQSLWSKYLGVWIIIILLGIFLLIAATWRLFFYTPPIAPVQAMKMIPEQKVYEQKVTINETMDAKQDVNFHIEDIDYRDNVLIDHNPRRRKRLEQDIFRTTLDF